MYDETPHIIINIKLYIRETDATAHLMVSTYTLRRWRRQGYVDKFGTPPPKAYVCGRQILYSWRDLREWIEQRTFRRR